MKFKHILFLFFLIKYNSSQECPNIESVKKTACESINVGSNNKCYYIGPNNCKQAEKYSKCSDYTTSNPEDFEEEICNSISFKNNKCIVSGESACIPKKKTCTEYKSEDEDVCSELDAENLTHECTLINGNCQSILKCSLINVETDCTPEKTSNQCIWKNIEGTNKCSELTICEDYKGTNENICSSINVGNDKKCIYSSEPDSDGNRCHEKGKTCEDYYYISDGPGCEDYSPTNNSMICITPETEGKCIEQFKDCETYDLKRTDDELTLNKKICEDIKPLKSDSSSNDDFDYFSNCTLTSGECKRIPKTTCNEFNIKKNCEDFNGLNDKENKMCAFVGGLCKEVYKLCKSDLTGKACTGIELYSIDTHQIDYSRVCIEDGSCKVKEFSVCSDYNNNEVYCNNVLSNDKKCAFIGNECKEQLKTCDKSVTDREKCESIKIIEGDYKDYYKCVLDKDKECIPKKLMCEGSPGTNDEECKQYETSDTNKFCIYDSNSKCKEIYKYCSDYNGKDITKDKAPCESIIPYDESGSLPLPTHKCEFITNVGCVKKAKACNEAHTDIECTNMTPSDKDNMKCIFYEGKCNEQYKTCENYNLNCQSNNKVVDETICKNIKLESNSQKCVYTPKDGETPAKCETKSISCSDYNNFLMNVCQSFSPTTQTKCLYSNSACTKESKTCLELSITQEDITDDICKNAKTSNDNKECKLKANKKGCEEKDKPQGGSDSEESGSGESGSGESGSGESNSGSGEEAGNNSACKNLVSYLLFVMIYLLY